MTVHAVIPVFNRLDLTKSLVACLRKQILCQHLCIIVVNDGSTDETSDWLAAQNDIVVLSGDGTLFWGGAVDLAMHYLQDKAAREDWVLLINNDTIVAEDFVQRLLDASQAYALAAVGSIIRDNTDHNRILSIGVRVNAWRLLVEDFLDLLGTRPLTEPIIEVDALSGRGVLFPMAGLKMAGGMKPRLLPHYLSDYELSMRVRKSGYRLFVLTDCAVYSADKYGSKCRFFSWRERFFGVGSPGYLPAVIVFWWEASSWIQRLTLPIRVPLLILFPRLRKSKV